MINKTVFPKIMGIYGELRSLAIPIAGSTASSPVFLPGVFSRKCVSVLAKIFQDFSAVGFLVSCAVVGGSNLPAFTARPAEFTSMPSILWRKFVPFRAMRRSVRPAKSRLAPSQVLAMGNSFKVVWVNAKRVSTEVVNHIAVWDRAACDLIREPVRGSVFALDVELSIASTGGACCPEPTAFGLIHFVPKSFHAAFIGTGGIFVKQDWGSTI